MFSLDAVLIWGCLFRQNTHKAAITVVIACFLYIFMVLMLYFLVFTAAFMGWAKFGTSIHFGYCTCNCYVICQIIIYIYIYVYIYIYIIIKQFGFVFLFIPSLC